MSDDESDTKGKGAGAGASAAAAGTGLGVTEAESFSGGDIARMLAVISAQMAEQGERLRRLERVGRAEPKARGAAMKSTGRVSLSRPPLSVTGIWPDYLPTISALKRDLDLEKQERVKARNQALVAHGGKFPAAKMDLAGFAEWSRSILSIAGGCGLLHAFLTEEQLEAAGYMEGVSDERDGRLADAREILAEGLQEALQCPASEGRHFLTEQNRNDPAQIWEDIHAVKRKSGVGDARAIQGCWLGLRMGDDESYASFIARVNAPYVLV
jgi:hypothetical protein